MSYDISLRDPITHEEIEVDEPHFMRGGTYQTGGCQTLWLNITHGGQCHAATASVDRQGEDA